MVDEHLQSSVILCKIRHTLTRLALLALATLLRSTPGGFFGKRRLLQFCRQRLLKTLPDNFTADLSLATAVAPSVRFRCFQLSATQSDVLSEWILFTGTWQPALTAYLKRTLREGDTFVDCGANTGYFSLLAASLVRGGNGGVVSIEACPRTFERLQTNLALNPLRLAQVVRPIQLAAAEAAGSITLYQHRRDMLYNTTVAGAGAGGVAAGSEVWSVLQAQGLGGMSFGGAGKAVSQLAETAACWREVRVDKAALDDLLSERERATARVVKIDVEGGEWAVIRGMVGMLDDETLPELEVVVEVTPKWLELQRTSLPALLAFMGQRGFHPYVLEPDDYEISRVADEPFGSRVARPKRIDPATYAMASAQVDVVFSRKDVEEL